MTKKEQVIKAIHMQGPEYVPLMYGKTMDDADMVNIPVEMHFTGNTKDFSEWGFQWDYIDRNLTFGQPKESVIKTWDDLKYYKAPDAFDQTRFSAIKEARERYGKDRYYKANFVLTGFSMMTMLRGFNNLLEDIYLKLEEFEKLADIVFGFEEDIIRQLKGYGFDALHPMEVKAGINPEEIKIKYGIDLVLNGGFNAVLWNDLEAIKAEMYRLLPVL